MDRLKLKELINTAINKLQDDKYRNDTIEDYKFTWKKFYDVNDTIRMYKNGKITMYKIVHKKYPI